MKNKIKLFSVPLLFAFICLLLGIISAVLALMNINNVLFIVISIALIIGAAILFFVHISLQKAGVNQLDEDKTAIVKALDKISKSEETTLLNVDSNDEQLVDIAKRINKIYLNQNVLVPNKFYKGNKFYDELIILMRRNDLDDFAYVRLTGINKKIYDEFINGYNKRYVHLAKEYIDIVIPAPYVREDIYNRCKEMLEKYNSMKAYIAYSRDYSLYDIMKFMDERYKLANPRLLVYEPNEKSFRSVSHKYASMDLAKYRILNDYLKDIYYFLPFSHIGIKYNDEYYRLCTLGTLKQIDQVDESEFVYFKKYDLFNFNGDKISLVLASTESVTFDASTEENVEEFCRMIRLLMVHELAHDEYDALERRYERLELLSNNLSYEVDDDYHIKYASKRLENHFNHSLLGETCYKALFNRNEPCKNCPMRVDDKNIFVLGSGKYQAKLSSNGDNETIYLLNQEKPYMPSKKDLSVKLLSLINNNSKGYILVFKLDNLLSTASRTKTDVEVIVNEIVEMLTVYGLNENLYRKEEDEFVYILEEAVAADALRIAKEVSKAFLEKFNTNNGEVGFAPKAIMLSYPLEVNTLFSLDALSRKLFGSFSDKGRLYRLDEPPVPIDNHRYFIEILERSYKEWNMPIKYNLIKDIKGNRHLSYVELDYHDDNGNPIPESDITLYTKIDGTYLNLMDKFIRALDFSVEKYEYILPIGKEGINLTEANALIPYFKSIKVDPSRLILEIKEKDAYNYGETVKKMMDLGFKFGIIVKDNLIYKINVLEYSYIKIDGSKLDNDKNYQFKVNNLLNQKVPFMVQEKYKDLLGNVRYVCK